MEDLPFRRKLYTETTVVLGAADTPVLPPNPKRCALLLSADATGANVRYSLSGKTPGAATGIVVSGTSSPQYLGVDAIWGACSGEIHANGTPGNSVTVGEWLFVH